jgi:hypothetical protein
MKQAKSIILFVFCFFATKYANAQTPTWLDISSIIYKNCTQCHSAGGIAPFSLIGYNNCKNMASSIASSTQSKRMPPWPADPKYRRYAHERVLSATEIEMLKKWADNDAPYGDTTIKIADPNQNNGTQLKNISLMLKMPNYTVNTSSDEYRCFVLPSNLTQNQFATALEVIPGNRSIVHHVLVFQDTSSIPTAKDLADPNPGYLAYGGTGSPTSQLIGIYVPGQEPMVFPAGFGTKMLKNTKIILQIHYPKGISNQLDSTKVALKLTTGNLREVFIASILNHNNNNMTNGPLYIPPGQTKTFYTKYVVGGKATIFACAPHMHLIGQKIKAYGLNANGDTTKIINIPNWDFHWQRTYSFYKPLIINAGLTLWGEAYYNNTSSNLFNPNSPPLAVSKGEGTTDEMMLIYFWYTGYQAGDENIVMDTTPLKNLSSVINPVKNSVNIAPIPANNCIQFSSNLAINQITLFSLEGQKMIEYQVDNQKNGSIQCQYQPDGMYILELKSNQSVTRKKILIAH